MHHIIEGIIEGETRVFSAGLTIKEMFEDREAFRKTVQDKVQKDMDHLGLRIYNANIAEMHDLDAANKYFETLKQKALETAKTEMRVEVRAVQHTILCYILSCRSHMTVIDMTSGKIAP